MLGGRTRIVVGSGDDRVALLVTMHARGVDVVAQAANASTASALQRSAPELDSALRPHGLSLLGFAAEGGNDQPSHGGRHEREASGLDGDGQPRREERDRSRSGADNPDGSPPESPRPPPRGIRVIA
jgi:hypothetical protein